MQSPSAGSARALVPLPILRGIAALVALASLLAGGAALYRDLTIAFRDAGPSVFGPTVRQQLDTLRDRLPAGAPLLLVSASRTDGSWYARLFQRGLYPRNPVVVRYLPLAPAAERAAIARWSVRHGLAIGNPPPDLGFAGHEDLGTLPALTDRLWLGELAR